ncbi:MAG: hypothetical protein LBV03_02595 [Fusobacteriales bacterium]|jgi:hypothetical protein|nr:hypothetical protein [Fusobacteriales bacterium]
MIRELIQGMILDNEYKLIKEEYEEDTEEEIQEALKIKSFCDLKDWDGIKWDYDINYKTNLKEVTLSE